MFHSCKKFFVLALLLGYGCCVMLRSIFAPNNQSKSIKLGYLYAAKLDEV